MSKRKVTVERGPAQTAKIIHLPHEDFSFKPYKFKDDLVEVYLERKVYVDIVQSLLRMTPTAMKEKLTGAVAADLPGAPALIHDLGQQADNFDALAELFRSAVARLTVVDAKLI